MAEITAEQLTEALREAYRLGQNQSNIHHPDVLIDRIRSKLIPDPAPSRPKEPGFYWAESNLGTPCMMVDSGNPNTPALLVFRDTSNTNFYPFGNQIKRIIGKIEPPTT